MTRNLTIVRCIAKGSMHRLLLKTPSGDVPGQEQAAQERVPAQGGEADGQDDGKYIHDSTHA